MLRRILRILTVTQVFFGAVLCATINQTTFDTNVALYGNKTANLMELQNVTRDLNSQSHATGVHYEVPSFLGISTTEIQDYLKAQNVYEKVQTLWHQFQTHQKLDDPNLSPEAITELEEIQTTIRNAFLGENNLVFESKSLSTFLAKAKKEKKLLMVRSTGKEDSKGNVNAGGNESISAVNPDAKAVTKAMGEVVASYFSQRSISQRLMVNDPALVDQKAPLFMPVLLQVMIGEPLGGSKAEISIPTSGVMFSREAEGRTPGVTHIQATYGHNEGVVNGTVAFDTFYIGTSLVIHPLIQVKRDRLVPASGSTLKRKANAKIMQTKPCLSAEQLQTLKKCADAIETYYNEPDGMDIEFVIQQNNVSIVQARPVAHKKSEPSYLKKEFVQASLPTNKLPLIIISAGGGQVQIIDYAGSVIVAETINEAYDTFLYKTNNKEGIKTVILGQMAPSMSHEVNMLRGAGKQVVYVADLGTIKTWLTEVATSPLLIDTQRELIVKFAPADHGTVAAQTAEPDVIQEKTTRSTPSTTALLEDTSTQPATQKNIIQISTPTGVIEQGWLTHPIAKKVSLFSAFSSPLSEEQAELLKPENLLPQATIATLINTIQESDRATANAALKTLLFHVARRIIIEKTSKKTPIDPALLAHLSDVFAHMRVTAYEAYQALEAWDLSEKKSEDMVTRLYPTTFLQALINQIPSKNLFVNDYSLGSLLKTEKQEKALAQELTITGPEAERIIQYAKASQYALTDDVQKSWQSFLKDFSTVSDPAVHNDFARVVHTVTSTDILPLWINTSFYTATKLDPETQQKKTAQGIATTLVQEFKEAEPFIAELQKKRTQLNTLTMQAWEDPAKFNKLWREFTTEFVGYFANKQFNDNYAAAPELGKIAALALMQHFVSIFDTSIKTLEASRSYAGEDKYTKQVQNFKTMLDGYFNVLQQWGALLESDTNLRNHLLTRKPGQTLQGHFGVIESLLNDSSPSFNASSSFNVAAAVLGSQADWNRSIGDNFTYEDIFSLTHQNLLIIIGALTRKTGVTTMPEPPIINLLKRNIHEQYKAERYTSLTLNLTGINFANNILTYYYNTPIRFHSNTIEIIYNAKNKTTSVVVQFLGDARERWRAAYNWVQVFDLPFSVAPHIDEDKGIVSFGWYINSDSQALRAAVLLRAFNLFTYLNDGRNFLEIMESQKILKTLLENGEKILEKTLAILEKNSTEPDIKDKALELLLKTLYQNRTLSSEKSNNLKIRIIDSLVNFLQNDSADLGNQADLSFEENLQRSQSNSAKNNKKRNIIEYLLQIPPSPLSTKQKNIVVSYFIENLDGYSWLPPYIETLARNLLTDPTVSLTNEQREIITQNLKRE